MFGMTMDLATQTRFTRKEREVRNTEERKSFFARPTCEYGADLIPLILLLLPY